MAYSFINMQLGLQPIATTDTTLMAAVPLGTILQATDPTYGPGEFIYLKGVASTAIGSWVTFNYDDWTTALAVADAIGPVAISMSANTAATSYGWYQISGKASGLALASFADNGNVYLTATAGSVDDAVVAGDYVYGAKGASTITGAGLADFEISRPFVKDGILADGVTT